MTDNRHWIEMIINHIDTGRVPFNFSFTPPARYALEEYYDSPLENVLDFPIRMSGPKSIKPLYADPEIYGETTGDEYGVSWSTSRLDRGSPVVPCLKEADLTGYRFPDAGAEYRFEDLGDWCRANKEHYRILWAGDLWERATFMRGMEEILLDLAFNRNFVGDLLEGIAAYILQTIDIMAGRFDFEAIALSDDYGTQTSMLMSPRDWRELIKPHLVEIYGRIKSHGHKVFHHSCGHIYPVIGDMIDAGLDILHPIQPEAMDITEIKRDFGRHITLCGGLNTQELLPRGTPQAIREEIARLKRDIGAGGGYILEPGITIQADVPLANMVAMIEEARRS